MKVKRFVAPDMRQAIRMVREALGPDAVILSNKTIEDGVELMAAVDLEQTNLPETQDGHVNGNNSAPEYRVTNAGAAPAAAEPWTEMRREMRELRRLMESELGELNWRELGQRSPQTRETLRRLLSLGLSDELAKNITSSLSDIHDPATAWHHALRQLASQIPMFEAEMLDRGGIVALIGPTGVGKTTTIAKLAARFALRHGNRHVGLITIDNFRIGARDQLHTYASILNVPVRSVTTAAELDTAIDAVSDRRLILIDTAGLGTRNERFGDQLALLNDGKHEITRLLALSAHTEQQALERTVALFQALQPDACVLTKLDESAVLGGVLSTVIKHQLPVAFCSNGQRVPEDLQLARAHTLVSLAAELAESLDDEPEARLVASAFRDGRTHAQL